MQKSSINNGLFLGIAMIISTYALYLANPKMFLSARSIILFMIFIIILVKAGLDARKAMGGYISFGKAFQNMFVTGAIATALCTMFEYVLMNHIDPTLIDMQKEIAMEAAESVKGLLSGMGDEYEEAFDAEMEKIETSNPVSLPNTLKNYLVRLVAPVALMSAIIGLIIKRNSPGNPDILDKPEQGYVINK